MATVPSRPELAHALGLSTVGADQLFCALRDSSPAGITGPEATIAFSAFCEALDATVGSATFDAAGTLPQQLFCLFSSDGTSSSVAVFDEVASGLSVLCAADRDGTMGAIFDHFDKDGSNTLSRSELDRFLVGLFKLMFASDAKSMRKVGKNPAQLAERMGAKMFAAADKDHSGTIERGEFAEWFQSWYKPGKAAAADSTAATPAPVPPAAATEAKAKDANAKKATTDAKPAAVQPMKQSTGDAVRPSMLYPSNPPVEPPLRASTRPPAPTPPPPPSVQPSPAPSARSAPAQAATPAVVGPVSLPPAPSPLPSLPSNASSSSETTEAVVVTAAAVPLPQPSPRRPTPTAAKTEEEALMERTIAIGIAIQAAKQRKEERERPPQIPPPIYQDAPTSAPADIDDSPLTTLLADLDHLRTTIVTEWDMRVGERGAPRSVGDTMPIFLLTEQLDNEPWDASHSLLREAPPAAAAAAAAAAAPNASLPASSSLAYRGTLRTPEGIVYRVQFRSAELGMSRDAYGSWRADDVSGPIHYTVLDAPFHIAELIGVRGTEFVEGSFDGHVMRLRGVHVTAPELEPVTDLYELAVDGNELLRGHIGGVQICFARHGLATLQRLNKHNPNAATATIPRYRARFVETLNRIGSFHGVVTASFGWRFNVRVDGAQFTSFVDDAHHTRVVGPVDWRVLSAPTDLALGRCSTELVDGIVDEDERRWTGGGNSVTNPSITSAHRSMTFTFAEEESRTVLWCRFNGGDEVRFEAEETEEPLVEERRAVDQFRSETLARQLDEVRSEADAWRQRYESANAELTRSSTAPPPPHLASSTPLSSQQTPLPKVVSAKEDQSASSPVPRCTSSGVDAIPFLVLVSTSTGGDVGPTTSSQYEEEERIRAMLLVWRRSVGLLRSASQRLTTLHQQLRGGAKLPRSSVDNLLFHVKETREQQQQLAIDLSDRAAAFRARWGVEALSLDGERVPLLLPNPRGKRL